MIRYVVSAAFALAVTFLSADGAAAAPAGTPGIVVTGLQPSPGAVEFFVSGHDLPAGTTLAGAKVTATADGVPLATEIRTVIATSGGAPARAVVLVLDTSGSMAGARLAAARAAALDYAAAAPADVRLGLVTISDTAAVALAPTTDRTAFGATVARLAARGRTALYDGITLAGSLLDPRRNPAAAGFLERRVVVLSDGADTSSRVSADRLLSGVARVDATMDAVAFGADADRRRLEELTGVTGGRVLTAADAPALRASFRGMAEGLSAPVVVRAGVPAELAGRPAVLRVQARLGAAVLSAEAPVTFRADPATGSRPLPVLAPASRQPGPAVTLVLVAVAIFGSTLLALRPLVARGRVQRRLRELDRFAPTRRGAPAEAPDGNGLVRAVMGVSERAVSKPDRRKRLELALDRAGSSLRPAEWQLIRLGCAVGGAVALLPVAPWWAALPGGMLAGWCGSGLYLRLRATRRTRAFADQLPDALQLLVGSLRSGFSLPQSLDALVRDGAEPIAEELGRALAETRLGGDLEESLERVAERNASQDLTWLVMAIRIQREVGGSLSEVLETAVTTMRDRARLHRHVRALSAEGRLSALILLSMPIVLGAWMFVFRREYLRPLYTEPLGLLMLGTSVTGILIGALWLRKLVQVEV
ncbi:type II secretion system F family protein [Actinoplanes sp. NPDC051346]|uniref:type II secretion system F family protein n=1 Tax=Actinoplanes sp. NPDC051346 TaxID=3155048 RepID=UPI00343B76F4